MDNFEPVIDALIENNPQITQNDTIASQTVQLGLNASILYMIRHYLSLTQRKQIIDTVTQKIRKKAISSFQNQFNDINIDREDYLVLLNDNLNIAKCKLEEALL